MKLTEIYQNKKTVLSFEIFPPKKEEELKNMRADWKTEEEPDMCAEIQLLKNWIKEKENLKKER